MQGDNLTLRELGKSKSRRINAPKKIQIIEISERNNKICRFKMLKTLQKEKKMLKTRYRQI